MSKVRSYRIVRKGSSMPSFSLQVLRKRSSFFKRREVWEEIYTFDTIKKAREMARTFLYHEELRFKHPPIEEYYYE